MRNQNWKTKVHLNSKDFLNKMPGSLVLSPERNEKTGFCLYVDVWIWIFLLLFPLAKSG